MKVMKRRLLLHIQLSPKTAKKFEAVSSQLGMTRYTLANRLMDWFAEQDSEIRQRILDARDAKQSEEIAQIILKQIADGTKGPIDRSTK